MVGRENLPDRNGAIWRAATPTGLREGRDKHLNVSSLDTQKPDCAASMKSWKLPNQEWCECTRILPILRLLLTVITELLLDKHQIVLRKRLQFRLTGLPWQIQSAVEHREINSFRERHLWSDLWFPPPLFLSLSLSFGCFWVTQFKAVTISAMHHFFRAAAEPLSD